MINKLVDAKALGWEGGKKTTPGKSIGSRHLFNNGRPTHDQETERWMDISGTTTSLKKRKIK